MIAGSHTLTVRAKHAPRISPGKWTLTDIGGALLVVAALTSPWNALNIANNRPGVLFLALAALLISLDTLATRAPGRSPLWVWLPALAVAIVVGVHAVIPVDASYLLGRFEYVTALDVTTINPWVRAGQWVLAMTVLPAVLALAARRRPAWVPRVITAWVIGAAVSALVAILDFAGITNVSVTLLGFQNGLSRGAGLSFHPNSLGISCAVAAPAALWIMGGRRWLGLLLLAVTSAGAVFSGSRAAQAGVIVGILLVLMFATRSRRVIPWLIGLVAAIVVYVLVLDPSILQQTSELFRFSSANAAQSDEGRSDLAAQALLDLQHSPLHGLGIEYVLLAHNIYLQLLAAGGLLLFLAVVSYWVMSIRDAWRVRGFESGLTVYLAVSVSVWLLGGWVSNQLIDPFLYFPVAGIAAAFAVTTSRGTQPPDAPGKAHRRIFERRGADARRQYRSV
ncbi:O-antigen ligase family protein [Microbacterium sp. Leaf151]|uniref:O-antigen ligase family protein n=1 Tax=Microbacterium sp. Leaf151 TaxID=1736276 RepID=UPI000B0ECE7F|nr:O-antigen ligase family protein [Microbacterium sp. Leaf151]